MGFCSKYKSKSSNKGNMRAFIYGKSNGNRVVGCKKKTKRIKGGK